MLRTVALGSGLVSLIPVVSAATPVKETAVGPQRPPPMKVADLPVYDSPHADYAEHVAAKSEEDDSYTLVRSTLLGPVAAVREQVQAVWQQTSAIKNTVTDTCSEFQDRTDWIVKYLREEDNKEQRYGAVVMGGLTGYILGLRGGIIKRLFYAGLGTSAMGFVCFPEESSEIAKQNLVYAKQYINIAYNFIYGVKPGDPQLEVQFPDLTLPKDMSEFTALAASVASSIKQAVMPPPAGNDDAKDKKPSGKKD